MYDFVDRPVTSLNRGGRLLVRSMRRWVAAVSSGRCPCGELTPAFQRAEMMAGHSHFHVMMAVLNGHAREQFRFCAPECLYVTEHEALLLALIRAAHGDVDQARETVRLMVSSAAVTPMLVAVAALAEALASADRWPLPPISDQECVRHSLRGRGLGNGGTPAPP